MTQRGVPSVSVIMAAYNAEPFICEAIASVRAQTFDDWELVICDDGSTDRTATMVESLARSDSRIRLVRHTENRGLSAARNTAFANSLGRHIALLDADDVCPPHRIAMQLDWVSQHPDSIIMAGYHHIHRENSPCDLYLPNELSEAALWACPVICGATMLLARTTFESIGGFALSIPDFQDLDLLLRASLKGHAFVTVPQDLYGYRLHGGSLAARSRTGFYRRINQYLSGMWEKHLSGRDQRRSLFDRAIYGLRKGHWPIGQTNPLRRKASSVCLHLAIRFDACGDQDMAQILLREALKLCWWRGDALVTRLTLLWGMGLHLTSFGDRRFPRVVVTRNASVIGMV